MTFDYENLPPDLAAEARKIADKVRGKQTKEAVEIGRLLLKMKEPLGHGHFTDWVEAECDMSIRTAQNYMNAARWAAKNENVSLLARLPLSVVYLLAGDIIPPEVERGVIDDYGANNGPSAAEVKRRIETARHEAREADAAADIVITHLEVLNNAQLLRAVRRALSYLLADAFEPEEREAFLADLARITPPEQKDIEAAEAQEPGQHSANEDDNEEAEEAASDLVAAE